MKCPHCHRTLYSRRPRCEHCGQTLPEECLVPPAWEEALKAEAAEIRGRIARTRAEARENERRDGVPPPALPPPGF